MAKTKNTRTVKAVAKGSAKSNGAAKTRPPRRRSRRTLRLRVSR
jgi:hypothetical protein